jgi:hypothetical protein
MLSGSARGHGQAPRRPVLNSSVAYEPRHLPAQAVRRLQPGLRRRPDRIVGPRGEASELEQMPADVAMELQMAHCWGLTACPRRTGRLPGCPGSAEAATELRVTRHGRHPGRLPGGTPDRRRGSGNMWGAGIRLPRIRMSAVCAVFPVKPSRKLRWFESNTCHHLRKRQLTCVYAAVKIVDHVPLSPTMTRSIGRCTDVLRTGP